MKKKTTEEFVKEAREELAILGTRDNYDLSLTEYTNAKTKISVRCVKHGEFQIAPFHFLNGKGCRECWRERTSTNNRKDSSEVIAAAIEVHRDTHGGIYDYSKYVYLNRNTKGIIICPEHGEFELSMVSHISRQMGCRECLLEAKRRDVEYEGMEYLRKAGEEKHGGSHTYDNVKYVDCKTKVSITCVEHGDFQVTPDSYKHNKEGCPACIAEARLKRYTKKIKVPINVKENRAKAFMDKLVSILQTKGELDKYDLSEIQYVSAMTNVTIICKEHGTRRMLPINLLKGRGCRECGKRKTGRALAHSQEEVLAKALIKHNNKYSYEKYVYSNSGTPSIITCPAHGDFSMSMANHLFGKYCPKCRVEDTAPSRKAKQLENFLRKAVIAHSYKYDYSNILEYHPHPHKLPVSCEDHGVFYVAAGDHLNGPAGCPSCVHQVSKPELVIREFVSGILPDEPVEYNVAVLGGRHHVDIFLPALKLGIEFHGLYWHSDKFGKEGLHIKKHKLALKAGIRLLQIFEDDWTYRRETTLDSIREALLKEDVLRIKELAENCLSSLDLVVDNTKGLDLELLQLGFCAVEEYPPKSWYVVRYSRVEIEEYHKKIAECGDVDVNRKKPYKIYDAGSTKWRFVKPT